jgi:hypothetical protein
MKHCVLLAASAATLLLGARLVCAQPAPITFEQIDKNKDGVLTKDEVAAFFEARRAAGGGGQGRGPGAGGPPGGAQGGGQGRGPGAGGPPGGPPDPAQVFARWDTNGDGKVTKAEFDARPRPGGPGGAGGQGPPRQQ